MANRTSSPPPHWTVYLTAALVVAGWFASAYTEKSRDISAKRREMRVQYLADTYRAIFGVAARQASLPLTERDRIAFEAGIADIQLRGTRSQIQKAWKLCECLNQKKDPCQGDALLNDLRNDLRRELDLPEESGEIYWLRFLDLSR